VTTEHRVILFSGLRALCKRGNGYVGLQGCGGSVDGEM
jgi:hypothetical protein